MKTKKMKVYIKDGYHVDSRESGKYQEYWVTNCDKNMNPYEFALYKLSDSDSENPGGYMVGIPAMMENIEYKRCYKILESPRTNMSLNYRIKFEFNLALRYVTWFFIIIFMKSRLERERLMKNAQLLDKEETLFYKWNPDQFKSRFVRDESNKATDLYDEMFFK